MVVQVSVKTTCCFSLWDYPKLINFFLYSQWHFLKLSNLCLANRAFWTPPQTNTLDPHILQQKTPADCTLLVMCVHVIVHTSRINPKILDLFDINNTQIITKSDLSINTDRPKRPPSTSDDQKGTALYHRSRYKSEWWCISDTISLLLAQVCFYLDFYWLFIIYSHFIRLHFFFRQNSGSLLEWRDLEIAQLLTRPELTPPPPPTNFSSPHCHYPLSAYQVSNSGLPRVCNPVPRFPCLSAPHSQQNIPWFCTRRYLWIWGVFWASTHG